MKAKFYGMLMQFTKGTTPCRNHLARHYSTELIDEAIELGYIIQIRINETGDPVYAITDKGKELRDR